LGSVISGYFDEISEACTARVVQQVAEYFSLLSEPMRLRLLNLRDGEKCVQSWLKRKQVKRCFKAPEDYVKQES